LKILRAQRYQAKADRLPEVSLDVATENGEDDMNSYSGSLSISWEIDLWQKLADSESAAGMDEAADLRTSVAYKDVLPSISLGAVLKYMSDSPQSLRLTDPVWTLLGQLSASLFQGEVEVSG
jgi:outer membrane protein TolC